METIALYMSPQGADHEMGTVESPLKTVHGVFRRLLEMNFKARRTSPVQVFLRGGEYPLTEPMTFSLEHSMPIHFMAYEGETPVFTGGQRIEGLKEETTAQGLRVWKAALPEVKRGGWYFRQLFVNGERRNRPRLPKQGLYTMEDVPDIDGSRNCWDQLFAGTHRFVYRTGDFTAYKNLKDIEVVAHHFWVDERMPVSSVDFATRTITSDTRAVFVLQNDNGHGFAKYYFENVFEGLNEPGEWYLSREEGMLYYLPYPKERLEDAVIIAPRINQFLQINGCPEEGRYVENITFSGITFEYGDWVHTRPLPLKDSEYFLVDRFHLGDMPCATAPQAALHVPGAISLRGVKNCAFKNCMIRHVGFYGMEFRDGCFGNSVTHCHIEDTGAGGIRSGGSWEESKPLIQNGNNDFSDNHIFHGGEIFRAGVGILMTHSFRNIIRRNEIHDYYYTAISSGWVWGFCDNISKENLIEDNDIHHLGKRLISDMGGVYILGIQAGTIIRGNHIRHVESCNYGGWGIYLDEGSSYVLVENNLVHHVSNQCFNQHYGRENIIRNNIFAFGGDCAASLQRLNVGKPFAFWPVSAYTRNSATFLHNIFLSDGKPFHLFTDAQPDEKYFSGQGNVYWNTALKREGEKAGALCRKAGKETVLSLEKLQALRFASQYIYADPDVSICDDGYAIASDSIALASGFEPFALWRAP